MELPWSPLTRLVSCALRLAGYCRPSFELGWLTRRRPLHSNVCNNRRRSGKTVRT